MADLMTFGEALPGIVILRDFERSLELWAAQRELLRPFFKQLYSFDLPQNTPLCMVDLTTFDEAFHGIGIF